MKNKMVVLGLCAVVGSLFSSVVPERQDPAPKDGIRDFVVTTDRADDFSSAKVKVAGDGTAKLYDAAFQEVPLKLDRPRTGRGQLRPGADEEVCFPVQSETWGCDLKVLKRSAGGIATRRARPIRFVVDPRPLASFHYTLTFHSCAATNRIGRIYAGCSVSTQSQTLDAVASHLSPRSTDWPSESQS